MGKKKSAEGTQRKKPKVVEAKPKAVALAALYICESMLLELHASEILSAKDIRGLLADASTTLLNTKKNRKVCAAASRIVNLISEQYETRPKG